MSDTMLLGVLRMPFDLAMATLTAQIQYHQRGVQAADEIEKLTRELDEARAEVARLRDEDTKTRHALRGWVYVCPDGGDEPTHERVAAVVAEVERLRRIKAMLDRNEREFIAAIGLVTTTLLGPKHDFSNPIPSMKRVLDEVEKRTRERDDAWAEVERLRAVLHARRPDPNEEDL